MDIDREIKKVIIVGIGSGLNDISYQSNRTFDYTPSQDKNWDEQFEKDVAKFFKLDSNSLKGKFHTVEPKNSCNA